MSTTTRVRPSSSRLAVLRHRLLLVGAACAGWVWRRCGAHGPAFWVAGRPFCRPVAGWVGDRALALATRWEQAAWADPVAMAALGYETYDDPDAEYAAGPDGAPVLVVSCDADGCRVVPVPGPLRVATPAELAHCDEATQASMACPCCSTPLGGDDAHLACPACGCHLTLSWATPTPGLATVVAAQVPQAWAPRTPQQWEDDSTQATWHGRP